MRAGNLLRWGMRVGEVLIAAIVLLMLTQLHVGIVQSALTMIGARTDAPLVLALDDGCQTKMTPPAWAKENIAAEAAAETIVSCKSTIDVIATLPLDEEVTLFVNDRPVETHATRSPLVKFRDVQLRPGMNTLLLASTRTQLDFPHPMLRRTGAMDSRDRRWFERMAWLKVPIIEAPFTTQVMLPPPAQPGAGVNVPPARKWYGPYIIDSGGRPERWFIAPGLPGADLGASPNGSTPWRQVVEADGLVLAKGGNAGAASAEAASVVVRRELKIGSAAENAIQLAMSACLPREHPFIAWSREGLIGPIELITRLTGFYLNERRSVGDVGWRDRGRIEVVDQPAEGCTWLKAAYEFKGTVERHWDHSFLRLPGDKLLLDAALETVLTPSREADIRADGVLVWHPGRDAPFDQALPYFSPNDVRPRMAAAQNQSPEAPAPAFQDPLRQRLLDRWRNLSEALPQAIQTVLWGFALVLPVALIYWALGRHRQESAFPLQIDRARSGVLGLLVFMTALALQQILSDASYVAIDVAGLWSFVIDRVRADDAYVPQLAPIAFVAAVMIVPFLRASNSPPSPPARAWTRLPAAILSISFVVLGIGVACLERWIVGGFSLDDLRVLTGNVEVAKELLDGETAAIPLALLVLAWSLFGLLVFWIPIYWLARTVLPGGAVIGGAFVASAVLFFVPMITPLIEALRILIAAATGSYGSYGAGPTALSLLAAATSIAGVVIMVTFVLRGFREITAVMLDPAAVPRFRSWTRTSVLVLAAILIVGPTTAVLANIDTAILRVHHVMTVFQAYGLMLALLAPLAALRIADNGRLSDDLDRRFRFDNSVVLLLTAAFAGYLSLWAREPIGAPILVLIGWFVFSKGIIGPPQSWDAAVVPGLAQRILAFRTDMRLLKARQKNYEKEFSEGKIDDQAFGVHRAGIAAEVERLRNALGMPVDEAKRRLLGLGLGVSPLRNGLVGAGAGLAVAALFQMVLPIDFRPASTGEAPAWLGILSAVIVDPGFRPVTAADTSRLLAVVSELLNAMAIWVFLGFMFGISFHRIRGSDGFAKAVVFGTGIAVTFLVSQALIARGDGVPLGTLGRLLPIFAFLILIGTLIFDGRSLRRQGVSLAQLPELYGMRASVGYMSFAGALAGLQPLLNLVEKLFSRSS